MLSGNLYDTKIELEKQRRETLYETCRKEAKLKEVTAEKNKFEEKVNSLLDVLYGCPECGCSSCKCTEAVDGDNYDRDQTFPPALPPETLSESFLCSHSQNIT